MAAVIIVWSRHGDHAARSRIAPYIVGGRCVHELRIVRQRYIRDCSRMTFLSAKPRVAIIGSGIIGAAAAWRLAQRGCRVELIDAAAISPAHRPATWASAGLLAPGVEAEPGEAALHRLCERSVALWPEFARELESVSGCALDFRESGSLVVALTRDDVARLQHAQRFHEALGTEQQWWTRDQVAQREPNLAGTVLAARYLPNDRQVNPRLVLTALHKLLPLLGVRVHDRVARAVTLTQSAAEVHGDDWTIIADMIVLATGAWSSEIDGLPDGWRAPVHPVKGQMLSVAMPANAPLLTHAVFTPRIYLVPRGDGELLVGATVEDRGFDADVTAGGLLHLLEAAWRALPAIESARVIDAWCGFRPGSRDDAPLLGLRTDRLMIATGHYRNGILLAPATADAVAEAVCTGRTPSWIDSFSPSRFDAANKPEHV